MADSHNKEKTLQALLGAAAPFGELVWDDER
jgi:hypothetical protein